jgi:hypothetical protein
MLPRKAKTIEGVDASSLVGLQAAVFRSQQQRLSGVPRNPAAAGPRGATRLGDDFLAARNRGVDERDARASEDDARERARSESALERKSELYAARMRGEHPPADADSLVNWERKQYEPRATLVSADMQRDAERRRWERNAAADTARGDADEFPPGAERNSSLKRFLSEVVQETNASRSQASAEQAKRARERSARDELIAAKRAAVRATATGS